MQIKMTLEEKFEKAKDVQPAWERVKFFSWSDLIGMRDRIKELEERLAKIPDHQGGDMETWPDR